MPNDDLPWADQPTTRADHNPKGATLGVLVVIASFAVGVGGASVLFDSSKPSPDTGVTSPTISAADSWGFIPGDHGWVKFGAGLMHSPSPSKSDDGPMSQIALVGMDGVTEVRADIKDPSETTGVVFLYKDQTNYYRAVVSRGLSAAVVQRVVDGQVTSLKSARMGSEGTSTGFRISLTDNAVDVYKDGKLWWSAPADGAVDLDVVGVTCLRNRSDASIYSFSVESS